MAKQNEPAKRKSVLLGLVCFWNIERTNTMAADRIICDIEIRAEFQRLRSVQDLRKRLLVNVAQHGMEEAGPDIPDASTTADTQGALQRGETASACWR